MSIGVSAIGIEPIGVLQDDFEPAAVTIVPASVLNVEVYGLPLVSLFDFTVFEHDFTPMPRSTIWRAK